MDTIISTISPGLAPSYSPASTYAVDEFVLYQNKYWRCIITIAVPEAWNPAHWVEATNLLQGINEVVIGGSTEPTEGKLWVDLRGGPTPTDIALIAEFDPILPATYVRNFATSAIVRSTIISITDAILDNASIIKYPSYEQYERAYQSVLQERSSGPVGIEAQRSDFSPVSPANYVRNFLTSQAFVDAVDRVIRTSFTEESSESSGSSGDSSSEEGLQRTEAWKTDFSTSSPEQYVLDFLNGIYMSSVIEDVIRSLYNDAERSAYPIQEESSSSSYDQSTSSSSYEEDFTGRSVTGLDARDATDTNVALLKYRDANGEWQELELYNGVKRSDFAAIEADLTPTKSSIADIMTKLNTVIELLKGIQA